MSVHNTCSRGNLILWAISGWASSWLLLDFSSHDMTINPLPAITKPVSFCSRYVCNLFAKKEVNCCVVLVWDKISLKLASLMSKALPRVNSTWTAFPRNQDDVEFLREISNRCQTQWRLRDMIPWALPYPDKTRPPKSWKVFIDVGFDIFWATCIAFIATISAPGHSEAGILDWRTCFFKT